MAHLPPGLAATLRRKLEGEVFDAGGAFMIEVMESSGSEELKLFQERRVKAIRPIDAMADVFLIDHAWFFSPRDARKQLETIPQLHDRVASMLALGAEASVDTILENMWPLVSYFPTASCRVEIRARFEDVAFMDDEVGSALRHSSTPNAVLVPIVYESPERKTMETFSILWPIQALAEGDEVTVDRLALMEPPSRPPPPLWRESLLFGLGLHQQDPPPSELEGISADTFVEVQRSYAAGMARGGRVAPAHPAAGGGTVSQAAEPSSGVEAANLRHRTVGAGQDREVMKLKVCSDTGWVRDHLQPGHEHAHPSLSLTNTPDEAEVLWMSTSLHLLPEKFGFAARDDQVVNQLPFEACLVHKDHLPDTIALAYGASVPWIPETFVLTDHVQVAALVGRCVAEERATGQRPVWIVKPTSLARSIGTTVTSSLACIVRKMQTGPQIAQKYISNPLLFKGHKFDMRFVALVRLRPDHSAEVFAWRDFWIRVAGAPYTSARLDDVRTHLTAMHLLGDDVAAQPIPNPNSEHFTHLMSEARPDVDWTEKIHEIHGIMAQTLAAGFARCPGMLQRSNARAIYGFDFMLDDAVQPILLEVQYDPACKDGFAAKEALGCLLLGEDHHPHLVRLELPELPGDPEQWR